MDSFKEMWTLFWKNVWQTFKSSLIVLLMFVGVSSMVFMMTFKGTLSDGLTGTRAAWVFGGIAVGLAYQALMMFATGGQGYEMLVSGNLKRSSAEKYGSGYKISTHKEYKEDNSSSAKKNCGKIGYKPGSFLNGREIVLFKIGK